MESPAALRIRYGFLYPLPFPESAVKKGETKEVTRAKDKPGPVLKAMRDWGLTWDKSTRVLA